MDKAHNLASAARANLNNEMQGYADALQRTLTWHTMARCWDMTMPMMPVVRSKPLPLKLCNDPPRHTGWMTNRQAERRWQPHLRCRSDLSQMPPPLPCTECPINGHRLMCIVPNVGI